MPGYEAPEDTVEPYARVAAALVRPVLRGQSGRPAAGRTSRSRHVSAELREAVAPVADGLFSGMPVEKVVLASRPGRPSSGVISLEVFGHWRNTILDPGRFFEATIRHAAETIGLA